MATSGKDYICTFRLDPNKPGEAELVEGIERLRAGGATFKSIFLGLASAAVPAGPGTADGGRAQDPVPAIPAVPPAPAAAPAGYGIEDRFDANIRAMRVGGTVLYWTGNRGGTERTAS